MISLSSSSSGSHSNRNASGVGGKHLRSRLRSVMSDRVMRITRESSKQQQQNQAPKSDADKNVKIQRLLSGNASFNFTPIDDKKKSTILAATNIKSPTNSNYFNFKHQLVLSYNLSHF